MNICYVADVCWSHRVGEGLAPSLDKTLIPGFWVSGGDPTDDRLVQLSEEQKYTTIPICNNVVNISKHFFMDSCILNYKAIPKYFKIFHF